MLKLGSVKFRDRCAAHPRYDGSTPPPANCARCGKLRAIAQKHRELCELMSRFTPGRPPRPARRPPETAVQGYLFGEDAF